MKNDDELDDDDDDVVCCLLFVVCCLLFVVCCLDDGRVGGKFVLCTQNFVLAHTKFCVSLHKILCDSYTEFCVDPTQNFV